MKLGTVNIENIVYAIAGQRNQNDSPTKSRIHNYPNIRHCPVMLRWHYKSFFYNATLYSAHSRIDRAKMSVKTLRSPPSAEPPSLGIAVSGGIQSSTPERKNQKY